MQLQLFNEIHRFNAGAYYLKHTMLKSNNIISSSITRSLQDMELESLNGVSVMHVILFVIKTSTMLVDTDIIMILM